MLIICKCGAINEFNRESYGMFHDKFTCKKCIKSFIKLKTKTQTMANNILINGSICLSDLIEQAQKGHSAFTRSPKNNKVYVSITEWVNDEPNEYGHHASFLLNSTKEKKEAEGKIYIGNGKKAGNQEGQPVAKEQVATMAKTLDNLPF